MGSEIVIAEVGREDFKCKAIDISYCIKCFNADVYILSTLNINFGIEGYISYLTILSEAIKHSIIAHKIGDQRNKVIVGELVVHQSNPGLSMLVRLRNSITHLTNYKALNLSMRTWHSELRSLSGFDDPIPLSLVPFVENFYSVDNMLVLNDLYRRCTVAEKEVDSISRLQWCKENAPDALVGSSGEQILEYMSSSYDKFVLDSTRDIFSK